MIKDDLYIWEQEWDGKIISSYGESNSKGTTIMFNKSLDYEIMEEFIDKLGRYVILKVSIQETTFALASFYGPNKDNPELISKIIDIIDNIEYDKLILGGDFNFVNNVSIDKMGGNPVTNEKCRKTLENWINYNNHLDIWRILNPHSKRYTWFSNKKPIIGCRLDFFIISGNLNSNVKSSNILTSYNSDHCPITLTLEISAEKPGRGFWKLKNQLLEDNIYCENIIKTIIECAEIHKNTDNRLKWDTMKCQIRGTTISYISKSNKDKVNKIDLLDHDLLNLDKIRCDYDNLNEQAIIQNDLAMALKKDELDQHMTRITDHSYYRNKNLFYEHGDRPSKFFLNLEKSNRSNKRIYKLVDDNGKEHSTMKNILDEETRFYKKLYTSKIKCSNKEWNENFNNFIKNLEDSEIRKIPEDSKEELTTDITENEIWLIIKNSSKNKCPGSDGLPTEFYLKFWPYIKEHVLASYNDSLSEGELSISQKHGVISLIPKPQKDLTRLKNWRPITLLNQDYKYLAKCLADRCRDTLPHIINPDQTGFVPGRYIGTNIFRTLNLQDHCKDNNINGTLLNLDFEKAFDSIEWNFVFNAMLYFGFPEKLIKWLKIFYNDVQTCVVSNGNISEMFKPTRGVRQGCPLSPSLFVIAAELLAIYIRQNDTIKGIKTESTDYTVSQFADDTNIAIESGEQNIKNVFTLLKSFETLSGLKVNEDKSEILLLGNTERRSTGKYSMLVKDHIKSLGVLIYDTIAETLTVNYAIAQSNLENVLKLWSKVNMSLLGKVTIVKSMALSKLNYLLNVLPAPNQSIITDIEQKCYKFIWDNGPDKIKRKTMIAPIEQGGLGMEDLPSRIAAIKLSWILKIRNHAGNWKGYIMERMPFGDLNYFLRCNTRYCDIPRNLKQSIMLSEILIHWCIHNYTKEVTNPENIMGQNIWMNSNIKCNNKVLKNTTLMNAGVQWILDLLNRETLELLHYKEFILKYKVNCPFTTYYGICNSIPISWIKSIRRMVSNNEDVTPEPELIDTLEDCIKASRVMYQTIVSRKIVEPTDRIYKWFTRLDIEQDNIDPNEVIIAYTHSRKSIMCYKIRSFMYKFLMGEVAYRSRLVLMRIETSEICLNCRREKETLVHRYWSCPRVKRLWERLKLLIEGCTDIRNMNITREELLLGIVNSNTLRTNKTTSVIQTLSWLLKYYIYLENSRGGVLNENTWYKELINTINIEKAISYKNGNIAKFQTHWGYVFNFIKRL